MAVFTSHYRELTFYVDGKAYSFSNGSFSSTDSKVIAVLNKLPDAKQVEQQAEEKPKAPARKKPAPKSSDK
jgi:hypothetical protein